MRVRPGGNRRVIPDRQNIQNPTTLPVYDPPAAPHDYSPKVWNTMVGGLPQSASSTPERTLSFSTTILDSVIPFVYGERKVTGLCAARSDASSQYRKLIYIFAWGEQDSISDCEINGDAIGTIDWISTVYYRYGTGSESMPAGFTTLGDGDDFKKYAYVAFTIDTLAADVPASLDVTAVLGGQKIVDFLNVASPASYDFESDTVGSVPDGWSFLNESGSGGTGNVFQALGDKYWRLIPGVGQRIEYINDDVGDVGDVIVTGEFNRNIANTGVRIWIRHSGDSVYANSDGYILYIDNSALTIYTVTNNSVANTIGTTSAKYYTVGTKYNFRFEATGTTIRAWAGTGAWPGTWDVSGTDSTYSSGKIVIGSYYTTYYDDIDITPADTSSAYTNPGLVAYDIMTNSKWKGVDAARIDTDQWEDFVNWCDDSMGDSSARFAFNGVIYQRDPDAAIVEVLGHAFAEMYIGADGKFKIWSEKDPPAITGEWSASASATITEDSTAGSASTEVEAGDILYVGTNVRTVVSVTDDDTIVLDSALTVSGATVRLTSGVYLRKENLVKYPTGKNIAPSSIPEVVIVNHTQSNDWGSYQYPAPGDVTDDRRTEVTLSGCTNASQAKRYSATAKNLQASQPFLWNLVADGTASGIEPGDVLFFDDDVLTMQAVRALPPVTYLPNGQVRLSVREFDPSTNSIGTQVDDTPPSITPPWAVDDPDAPTAATQTFLEAGDWAEVTTLSDPDDLRTTQGWTAGTRMSTTYGSGATEFTVDTAGSDAYYYKALGGDASGLKLITCLAKTSDDNLFVNVMDAARTVSKVNMEVPADGLWHRLVAVADLLSTDVAYISGVSAANGDTLQIKRMRITDWEFDPSIALLESWTWTEHASASSSVDQYHLVSDTDRSVLFADVPQGSTSLEYTALVLGSGGPTPRWNDGLGLDMTMVAVGPNGGTADFPSPTQGTDTRTKIVSIDGSGFSGVLSTSDGDVETALATIDGMGVDAMRGADLASSARIGDITNGDYVDVSVDGHLTLEGDATVWEDLRFPATTIGRRGNSDPGWVQITDDGSSSIGVWGLGFDDSTDEEVYMAVQLPHAWKEGSDIYPHVHWAPNTGTLSDKGVAWFIEYSWVNIGKIDASGSSATFPNTTTNGTIDTDTFAAKEHRMINFDAISATGKTISSMLMIRLYRDVSNVADDYADDAILLEFDIHYEIDSIGSQTVSSKT